MDKRIMLAVAGSGKTYQIINSLNEKMSFLIIVYTISSYKSIKKRIEDKFTYFPPNIKLMTYYQFVYRFCYKPFLFLKFRSTGINFSSKPARGLPASKIGYFFTQSKRLYHSRVAKLIIEKCIDDVIDRIENHYDYIIIDEFQDFAGHDFNLVMNMIEANVNVLLVGDYYQHTYDTSRDGNTNKNLHNSIDNYIARFNKSCLDIDMKTLSNSWRCNPGICEFIRKQVGVEIYSHHKGKLSEIVFEVDKSLVETILGDDTVIKLLYESSSKYSFKSKNWGESKGDDDYDQVCIIVSDKLFLTLCSGSPSGLEGRTKCKFYVACSRARSKITFIKNTDCKSYRTKIKET